MTQPAAALPEPYRLARLATGPEATPGTLAAWAIAFGTDGPAGRRPLLTVGSDSYDGTLSATLPAALGGGRYEVVIEGLTDEDYQRLRGSRPLSAALHLWWRDSPTGVAGDLARIAGVGDLLGPAATSPPPTSLVAVIRVDTMRRQAGERRYDTVIAGRELVAARLGEARIRGGLCYVSLAAAARGVAGAAGITVVTHGIDTMPADAPPDAADVREGSALRAMQTIESQTANVLGRAGLSTAIIRDGTLHVGLWTARGTAEPLPVVRRLDPPGGLVSVERGTDAPAADGSPGAPGRTKVTAVALGRPDLKPGDLLQIPLPAADYPTLGTIGPGLPVLRDLTGLLGADADAPAPATCLITQVAHRLSRRHGFVTTVQATVLGAADDGWDKPAPAEPSRAAAQRGSVPADHAHVAAGAVEAVVRDITARAGLKLAAGQIRAHPDSQLSSTAWIASGPPDGLPLAVRRVPVTPDRHGELPPVPVVTPFAYGGFGLVLPRYPGARVLLADAGGGGRDVVDLGGVWEDNAQPPARTGDWWLLLPIGATTDDLSPQEAATPPNGGAASHDLIDADGRRLIETAGFTVRVTDRGTLATTRPEPGPAHSVVIQSTKGGKTGTVTLHDDGSITVSGTSISFEATDGDITMTAKNVKVKVSGTMDVST